MSPDDDVRPLRARVAVPPPIVRLIAEACSLIMTMDVRTESRNQARLSGG
jgi:hypothetical protein